MLGVILIGLSLVLEARTAITGYDCQPKTFNMTTISLREVGECNFDDLKPQITPTRIQLLQKISYEDTKVYICRITVTRIIKRCGMFSHNSEVNDGFNKFTYEINRETCIDMIKYGQIKVGNTIVSQLESNITNFRTIYMCGRYKDNGECVGENYSINGHEYESVVVTELLEIEYYQTLCSTNKENNLIYLPTGTRCEYGESRCEDAQKRQAFWTVVEPSQCHFEKFVILYEGPGVKVKDNQTGHVVHFGNSSTGIQFGLSESGEMILCGYKLLRTEHKQLYIFDLEATHSFATVRELGTSNVLQEVYFNTKISFLSKHIDSQFESMYRDILLHQCNLERNLIASSLTQVYNKPDLFALTIMKQQGYMAYPSGEVAHLIPCMPINCKLRLIETCYDEMPVECGEIEGFLQPNSHIFVRIGSPRPCNQLSPVYYMINGLWHRFPATSVDYILPEVIKPLTKPTWHNQRLEDFTNSGIYRPKDLDALREHLFFPMEQGVYLRELRNKLSNSELINSNVKFSNLIDKTDLESHFSSFFGKVMSGFQKFGTFCAGIFGILAIFQVLKMIVDSIIRGYMLHDIYGCSIKVLAACMGSLTHLLTHMRPSPTPDDANNGGAELMTINEADQPMVPRVPPRPTITIEPRPIEEIRRDIQARIDRSA